MGVKGYENGFDLTLQPHRLEEPLRRKKATKELFGKGYARDTVLKFIKAEAQKCRI
jgi:hypothetical protein